MLNHKTKKSYPESIKEAVSDLPYFKVEDLYDDSKNINYLRIALLRLKKRGKILSLKRGEYVSKEYLDKIKKRNNINSYLEFLATNMYEPSYLSLEYILSGCGVLSENVNAFTMISKNKTKKFINNFGIFNYKHIKDSLFTGFEIEKKDEFFIAKASLAKALFDFLYLRKNIILDENYFLELRLNIEVLRKKDIKEFKEYVKIENSKKMNDIFTYLQKTWEKKK